MNIRQIALRILDEYEAGDKYINLALSSHLTDNLSREEKAALTALLYSSVERKLTYDYYISALSGRGIDKIDLGVRNIIRLGLAQLFGHYVKSEIVDKALHSPGEAASGLIGDIALEYRGCGFLSSSVYKALGNHRCVFQH